MTVQEARFAGNRNKFYILWITTEGKYAIESNSFYTADEAEQFIRLQVSYGVFKAGKVLTKDEIIL